MPKGTATPMISPRLVLDDSVEVNPPVETELEMVVAPARLTVLKSLDKALGSS